MSNTTQVSRLGYSLPQLLKVLVDQKGSDLHLSVNSAPRIRLKGELLPLDLPALTQQHTIDLCYSVLNEEQKKEFEKNLDIDLAFAVKNLCRFRANVFIQRGNVSGVFRAIPEKVPTLSQLQLPNVVHELCSLPRGLILVTGPTGSGKTTTLACMIDFINSTYPYNIITLEDPIEFVHEHKLSLINQREVGRDAQSFARALRACLREDPDVVLVGELRDLESIALALTAAETGHLVLATLHTNSCVNSITRLIDVFPHQQQAQIRTQLSFSLVGVLSQMLVRGLDNKAVACMEIMIPNTAIRNLIREDKVHQLYSAMQVGQEGTHMRTMNQSLLDLILRKRTTPQAAYELSHDIAELRDLLLKNGVIQSASPRS